MSSNRKSEIEREEERERSGREGGERSLRKWVTNEEWEGRKREGGKEEGRKEGGTGGYVSNASDISQDFILYHTRLERYIVFVNSKMFYTILHQYVIIKTEIKNENAKCVHNKRSSRN